ncbi:hypothetical protein FS837_001933 [Tulasnella sp. UAMH 9824]|nr:hypothetical protein FS837_001933 [Tulasnella sp. UAMH 9824]
MYKYGFTEEAFNFQDGKEGEGGDAIEIGQPGHCNMYLWDLTTPKRDGDLSNDVITHEFTHGLTKRMTGGDTAASAPRKRVSKTDYALGAWVYNSPKGIRSVLYSTDMKLDPYTYGTVKTKHEARFSFCIQAFAKRGLGPKAANYVGDMSVPDGC